MPYSNMSDLPDSIQKHLPHHAQEIYLAAFNHAWEEYNHEEETAHRVAWAAVKKKYAKNEATGNWQAK